MTFIESNELSRSQVEKIAFDPSTPDRIAAQYLRVLKAADRMITGQDENRPGVCWAPEVLHFVYYSDVGLKLTF